MKKLSITFFLILSLLLTLCSSASADVITAMAIEINPEHLEKTASYARILGYNADSNTLTVELIAPERFSGEEVVALKEGDSIYTDGHEVLIESMSYDDDWCSTVFINDGDILLYQDRSGDYTMMSDEDDCVWNTVALIECPVKDSLLFLDYVEEETGNALELPVIYTAQELIAQLLEEEASEFFTIGLSTNNVYVLFDEAGQLAVIHRFYVPWQ
ncbi:MAG: hypothetical protein IK099_08725 [Clostridia bacterium]|nr:hypothetical protein [Clostridia bacterium]